MTRDRVGVIGGGLGGLAAACTLAARGYAVTVLERGERLGGKAAAVEAGGYTFDLGPTVLTLPGVLARVFAEAGASFEERVPLVALDPQWRCFFEDGAVLDLRADVDAMAREVEALAGPLDAAGYRRFMVVARRLHDVAERFFFWRPVGGLRDVLDAPGALRPGLLGDLLALRPGSSVARTVRAHVRDRRVAQLLDHFVQYVGSAPDASPAVLCGIAHMQARGGLWYPRGGVRAVARALSTLAVELGVELRAGVSVRRILLDGDGGVAGVETDAGERLPLRALVSNADVVRTHRDLLGGRPAARFERRRRYEPACSGVVLYLGLDRGYDHLLHHGFVFSRDPAEEFDAIYREGRPAPDPTCYVCAPARTDPAVAPPGGEALYVLVHAPSLRPGHDWRARLPAYRRTILAKLARTAGLDGLERRIRVERALTPEDIQARFAVLDGAIYGLASHGRLLGAFKPANRSPDVPRLYLAGGAAHPGPGVPMVVMSGWIAADALDRDGAVERREGRRAGEERRESA